MAISDRRSIRFSDGKIHYVSYEDYARLILLPVCERIYDEAWSIRRYRSRSIVNTYPVDAGEIRRHPTLEYINVSSNGYVQVYNKNNTFRFTKGSDAGKIGMVLRYKNKTYKVCRLIAETFIPNPANKPLVIHKDNDPSNNRVDNLF